MKLPNVVEVHHRGALLRPEQRHGVIAADAVCLAPEREWEQVVALEPMQEFAYPAKAYSFAIRTAPDGSRATVSSTGRFLPPSPGHYRIAISRAGHEWIYEFVAFAADIAARLCPGGDEEDQRDVVRAVSRGWRVDMATLLTLATTGQCPTEFNPESFGA